MCSSDLFRFHLVLNNHLDPIVLLPVGMSVETAAPMAANVLFRRMELHFSRIASFKYSVRGLAIASSYDDDDDDDDDDDGLELSRPPEPGFCKYTCQQLCCR